MTGNAPLFALGRILQPEPSPLGSQLAGYLQRHVTGDWGMCGSHTEGEGSGTPNSRTLRSGGTVVSLYRTPLGWLLIQTAKLRPGGEADEETQTCCFLVDEFWEGPFDQAPRSAEESTG